MNQNITKIEVNGKEIYLIGTAHVSHTSRQDVKDCIDEVKPDSICIELDEERFEAFNNPKRWENTDIIEVIKEKKTGYMLANLILSAYQRRIAKKMDVQAGQEMIQGIESAKEIGANLVLVDRNIQTTFKRIYRKHSFFQKLKLISSLVMSIFDDEDISSDDIESLKQSDALDVALKEVSKEYPVVSEVLIHERDQVLAYKIKNAPGNKIVAVLGAAHIPGIKEEIYKTYDIKELESIPAKKPSAKIIGWIIPLAIIAMILSLFSVNSTLGWEQVINWVLWNGSLSALGVLLAWGHPLAIIVAFIAAPITSLNPLLAAGWFAGLAEAFIRKPKVKDFENLLDDVNSIKGFYKNRITHILLVVIFANLFSTLGTMIGGFDVIKNFIQSFL
ncbi:TraB/GumN family protein [Anaerorhabdus sp.]|uniref:TraB/GumN family protein n=1 Tax=Anaerorhabdus sp. TaxID=1872524 RepID=UPI002B21B460|nr:TraB/GumN family protein [Anaerorhabdus sp.]MEA4874558.1 TraB/GumN family protein [Anaerorhabdus sp.]